MSKFIPVRRIHSIEYTYPTNNKTSNNLNSADWGSTTHINSYKNLYGLTLKNDENTSLGITLY